MALDTRVLMGGSVGCRHRLSLPKARHQLLDTSLVILANLSIRASKEVFHLNKAVHHHNPDSKDSTDRREMGHQAGRMATDNQLMVETSYSTQRQWLTTNTHPSTLHANNSMLRWLGNNDKLVANLLNSSNAIQETSFQIHVTLALSWHKTLEI